MKKVHLNTFYQCDSFLNRHPTTKSNSLLKINALLKVVELYKEEKISTEKFNRINFEEKITQIQSTLKYTPNSLKSLEARLEALHYYEGKPVEGLQALIFVTTAVAIPLIVNATMLFCCVQMDSLGERLIEKISIQIRDEILSAIYF